NPRPAGYRIVCGARSRVCGALSGQPCCSVRAQRVNKCAVGFDGGQAIESADDDPGDVAALRLWGSAWRRPTTFDIIDPAMAKPRKTSKGRRGFLKTAAGVTALAAAPPIAKAQAPAAAKPPVTPPSAAQRAAETATPSLAEVQIVEKPGSDFM